MSNEQQIRFVRKIKDKLDNVSPAFCLAKWTQSTIYLWNGHTHSCHHPGTHKVPLENLDQNPSQLHNTPYKQKLRHDMINGVKPPECEYCWNVENLGSDFLSDRHTKSAADWSAPYFNEIIESGTGANFAPRYIEIAFETTCNFKCTYCFPHISSRINEEYVTHGPYILANQQEYNSLDWIKQQGQYPISRKEYNPYIEAFWKWWPELYQKLDVFRITGGEPLLSKHTWAVLDYIDENPRKGLKFAINSNFGIEGSLVDKLIDKLNSISRKGVEVEVYTSLESTGKQAEYSRFGLDYNLFRRNVDKFLSETDAKIPLNFMTTVNILAVSTFTDFLKYILDLRAKYNVDSANSRVGVSISYLRYPEFLALPNLPADLKEFYGNQWVDLVKSNVRKYSSNLPTTAEFYLEELNQVERMVEWMKITPFWKGGDLQTQHDSFRLYHEEYDRRRNTVFSEVFPELASMIKNDRN